MAHGFSSSVSSRARSSECPALLAQIRGWAEVTTLGRQGQGHADTHRHCSPDALVKSMNPVPPQTLVQVLEQRWGSRILPIGYREPGAPPRVLCPGRAHLPTLRSAPAPGGALYRTLPSAPCVPCVGWTCGAAFTTDRRAGPVSPAGWPPPPPSERAPPQASWGYRSPPRKELVYLPLHPHLSSQHPEWNEDTPAGPEGTGRGFRSVTLGPQGSELWRLRPTDRGLPSSTAQGPLSELSLILGGRDGARAHECVQR